MKAPLLDCSLKSRLVLLMLAWRRGSLWLVQTSMSVAEDWLLDQRDRPVVWPFPPQRVILGWVTSDSRLAGRRVYLLDREKVPSGRKSLALAVGTLLDRANSSVQK